MNIFLKIKKHNRLLKRELLKAKKGSVINLTKLLISRDNVVKDCEINYQQPFNLSERDGGSWK